MHSVIEAKMKKETADYIDRFGQQLHFYLELMKEAFEGVINEDVSRYPVFIFHQQEMSVGLPIYERDQNNGEWSVNISTLEEFYIKGIVTIEQVEEIKAKIIGQPPQYCCMVLYEGKGSLIFVNRESDPA
jgi:hypothetical protein